MQSVAVVWIATTFCSIDIGTITTRTSCMRQKAVISTIEPSAFVAVIFWT
jgi:hypothetical protein